MKRICLVFGILVLASAATFAQTSKWIGGGLTISSTDDGNDQTTSSLRITPTIGFVLNDKWAVGGALILGSGKQENGTTEIKTSEVGIKPFARYSLGESGKFAFFGQGELPIVSYKTETETPAANFDSKYSSVGLHVRPGMTYHLSDKFAAELLMPSLMAFNTYSGDAEGSEFRLLFNSGYSIEDYLLEPTISFIYKF